MQKLFLRLRVIVALAGREGVESAEYKRIDRIHARTFARIFSLNDGDLSALFNRGSLLDGYYAYNLRLARSFTVHLLEQDRGRRDDGGGLHAKACLAVRAGPPEHPFHLFVCRRLGRSVPAG